MGQTLLITGGHGFLGRRLTRLASDAGWTVVSPTSGALDVRDEAAVRRAVATAAPDAVVHLAYRKSERDTIVDGSRAVARAAGHSEIRLVHLSTDVVFGGRTESYRERDAPHPVEPYGAAKAEAEAAVAVHAPTAAIVRTSLLLGDEDDPGQPELDAVQAARGELAFTFFTDEVRCPARAEDVAAAVLRLCSSHRDVSGPLHVAGPEAMDRAALARRIVASVGLDTDLITTATTAEAGLTGRRPGRVVLDVTRAESLGLGCRPL